ncbi:MAG: orotate phosphoribosyltransferase [Patescibacteria group bacterium]
MNKELKKEIAIDLHTIGAVKFGEFTFKSGVASPIYIDLRLLISYPRVLKKVIKLYEEMLGSLTYDRLAGVAYGALPITGAISFELERPWIFLRKEALQKAYGLEKSLEGEYKKGETAVMIEDLVTYATSLLETIPVIEQHGLIVKDAVALIDYEKGGREVLQKKGYNLYSAITMREIMDILFSEQMIHKRMYDLAQDFISKKELTNAAKIAN